MFPLLIIREEIICLIILIFLWINGLFYKMGKDHGSFQRMLIYATGHVVFDIVTVLTVNSLDRCPSWFNYTAHVIFYLFAILFSQEFSCYVIALCYKKPTQKRWRAVSLGLLALYLLLLPVLPIVYLQGNGTNYSLGPAAFMGYGLAMLYLLCSAMVLAINYRKLASHVRIALFPMLTVMIAAECFQIAIPELLITGGAATVVTMGFFFSLENPSDVFRQKVLIDALTGVKSRHSYETDIRLMEKEYARNPDISFGLVFCDINNLKAVNDIYGHLEGDAYISRIALILVRNFRNAEHIYRMGGDEFLAIYRNTDEAEIRREIEQINTECDAMSRETPYQLSVAMGCALSGKEYPTLREVLRVADYLMYKNKVEIKRNSAFLSENGQEVNLSALTDKIFDVFAATGERNYLTLTNLSTNVTRWAKAAVDYFGLPGEFIHDNYSIWLEHVHPDDRADYSADLYNVVMGNQKTHDIEFRAKNKAGEYVVCTCRGKVIKDKKGGPDLFAATLVNHGIAETIDSSTGLHNEQSLIQYLEGLLRDGKHASLLSVALFSFRQVNIIYGYKNGEQILHQFAEIINRLLDDKGQAFRTGSSVFCLVLPESESENIPALYNAMQDALKHEITVDSMTFPLHLSGGAFIMDESFIGGIPTIRNNLSYALDRSRREGHGRLVIYNNLAEAQSNGSVQLLSAIHKDAITARSGFYLEYQPIIRMDDKTVSGAEALIRWQDKQFGKVNPEQFISWLENDASFYQVMRWLFQKALTDAGQMLSIVPDFVININVSPIQLEDDRFNTMIMDTLRNTGFPPQQICLELTERCHELDFDLIEEEIRFFHSLGIRVALDDMCTGFATLDILLNFNGVDEIKLDRTFITDIRAHKKNQSIVRHLIQASQEIGYQICLEGIEDGETFEYLKGLGATYCQGFYFSKSLPARELRTFLMERQQGHK